MSWDGLSPPYATIVADPPWAYPEGFPTQSRTPGKWAGEVQTKPLPYSAMDVGDIKALPVADLASPNCRLFLWTTNRYLPDAFDVALRWGFRYRQALVWHKRDGNMGGSVAPCSVEFLLVCVSGSPPVLAQGRLSSHLDSSTEAAQPQACRALRPSRAGQPPAHTWTCSAVSLASVGTRGASATRGLREHLRWHAFR